MAVADWMVLKRQKLESSNWRDNWAATVSRWIWAVWVAAYSFDNKLREPASQRVFSHTSDLWAFRWRRWRCRDFTGELRQQNFLSLVDNGLSQCDGR